MLIYIIYLFARIGLHVAYSYYRRSATATAEAAGYISHMPNLPAFANSVLIRSMTVAADRYYI